VFNSQCYFLIVAAILTLQPNVLCVINYGVLHWWYYNSINDDKLRLLINFHCWYKKTKFENFTIDNGQGDQRWYVLIDNVSISLMMRKFGLSFNWNIIFDGSIRNIILMLYGPVYQTYCVWSMMGVCKNDTTIASKMRNYIRWSIGTFPLLIWENKIPKFHCQRWSTSSTMIYVLINDVSFSSWWKNVCCRLIVTSSLMVWEIYF
jgi:hypothetical protein